VRGTINVNGANAFGADAPFGGYRQSGIGREMGIEGFEEYLQTKTVAVPA
jgi:aldehyde dehydrogenase (NAD+)